MATKDQVWKVIGPPGTGKTTYVVRQIKHALEKLVHGRVVLASSLTKAAAIELRGRVYADVPEHLTWNDSLVIGTLHSHAYAAIGKPEVFGNKNKSLQDWNDWCDHQGLLEFQLSSALTEDDEEGYEATQSRHNGDGVYQDYHLVRARLVDRRIWPVHVARFAEHYERFKRDRDVVDFSDMIERAYHESDCGPGVPQFLFVDEAQDHDRAQFRLLTKWAARPEVERLIVVGDPKQNLYEWRGSEPEAFYSLTDNDHKKVLSKSYRVPRAAWEVARRISERMTDCEDDAYDPRDGDPGEVIEDFMPFTVKHGAEMCLQEAMMRDPNRSIMFLATCGYMLSPLLQALKSQGIPFHNPYKKDNNKFNPLGSRGGKGKHVSAVDRLLAFMEAAEHGTWTCKGLACWVDVCRVSEFLVHGKKKQIDAMAKKTPARLLQGHELGELFLPGQLDDITTKGLTWLLNRLRSEKASHYDYLFRVVKQYGVKALTDTPRIIVGTIHSVKGGEADVVYLATDLSWSEQCGFKHNENPIHRKFYVGVTRTRNKLVICRSAGSYGGYDL